MHADARFARQVDASNRDVEAIADEILRVVNQEDRP